MSGFLSAGIVGGSAVPNSRIDSFEKIQYEDKGNTLSTYYDGDLSAASRQQTSGVIDGSFAVEISVPDGSTGNSIHSDTTDGLNVYPKESKTFEVYMNISSSDTYAEFGFGLPDGDTARQNGYSVSWNGGGSTINLDEFSSGSANQLDSSSNVSGSAGDVYQFVVDYRDTDAGTISVDVINPSGTTETTLSTTDTTHSGGGFWMLSNEGSASGATTWDWWHLV